MARKRRNNLKHRRSGSEQPDRPITTADHLFLAVLLERLPDDPQICEDYGFNGALTIENQCMLLGLYIGLMKYMGVKPKTLHQWRVNGTLVREIKAAYERIPAWSRGAYYPWFLENQYVLDGSSSRPQKVSAEKAIKCAWKFTGGPASDNADTIKRKIAAMPKEKQDCHFLYQSLVNHMHPSPGVVGWVKFGFCATRCIAEETALGCNYRTLIERCTFEEFFTAYNSSSLLQLFHSKGIRPTIPHLEDVLKMTPWINKSVWNLKEYAICKDVRMLPSIWVDYGFAYCRTQQDTAELKNVYANYFRHNEGDPIALHNINAAVQGRLFEHVGRVIELNNKFRTIMLNPYPLPPESMINYFAARKVRVLDQGKPVVYVLMAVIVLCIAIFKNMY